MTHPTPPAPYSAAVGGVDIAYQEWPGEDPTVVFCHGISSSKENWNDVVGVRGDRRALAFDARGHGDSGRAPGTYTFVQHGIDAAELTREVFGAPVVLVGHSQGGMVAVHVAATQPELVRGIVLEDPPLYAPEVGLRDVEAVFRAIASVAGKPVADIEKLGFEGQHAHSVHRLDPAAMDEALDLSAVKGFRTDELLDAIECPVLLVHGSRELGSALYPGEVERALSHLRNARAIPIEQVGHLVHGMEPDRFKAAVGAFLDEVG